MVFIQEIIYLKYEYESIGTHWIALYVNANNIVYFDSLELDIFRKKLKNSLETKI